MESKNKLSDLIEALQIFVKYENKAWPTRCEHDELMVCIDPGIVSEEDILKLDELGFYAGYDVFQSTRFGSC